MIQFRPEQMARFETGAEDAFVWDMVRHLRTNFAADLAKRGIGTSDAELEPLVRASMKNARQYEFDRRPLLIFYIECAAQLGPRFDTDPAIPWAGEILRRTDLIPDSKADLLDQHLLFHTT